jgi:nucleoside-diphosphate kinase
VSAEDGHGFTLAAARRRGKPALGASWMRRYNVGPAGAGTARLASWEFESYHENLDAMQRTFIMFKPDCVQRRLVGRILTRFEDKGLQLVAMKLLKITPDLAKQHYAEHVQKGWYSTLEGFVTGGPVVAAVLEGLDAVRVVREMLGATNGLNAAPGTIRGDFSSSRQMNLVHASDGPEAAVREMALYFTDKEIIADVPTITPWLRASDET